MISIGYRLDPKAKPIAYVKGRVDDDKVIFLNKENLDKTELQNKLKKVYGGKIRLTGKDYKLVNQLLTENIEPQDERLKKIYNLMKPEIEAREEKSEYICYDGILQQLARKNENGDIISRQYVAAPSESGKSTYLSKLVQEYKRLKPKAKIYLFSDTPKDPVLDKLGVIRIKLDEELIEDPIEAEELAGGEESDFHSLFILDDIDSIINKKIFKQVAALRDQLLQKGRHHKISVICTNHKITSKNTSIILNESQFITLFPKGTCLKNFSYIFVGSTTKNLNVRFTGHKSTYKRGDCMSRILFREDEENCQIMLIENYPCNNEYELSLETYWKEQLDSVNKNKPTRTEDKKQYFKDYAIKHNLHEKFDCECGGKYTKMNKKIHEKTNKHKSWVKNKSKETTWKDIPEEIVHFHKFFYQ